MFLGSRQPFPFLESLTTLTVLATRAPSGSSSGPACWCCRCATPAVLAKATATLDIVSGGRLTLGVAAGWYEREFEACGVPFKRRGRVFEENLELLKELLERRAGVSGEARGHAVPQRA